MPIRTPAAYPQATPARKAENIFGSQKPDTIMIIPATPVKDLPKKVISEFKRTMLTGLYVAKKSRKTVLANQLFILVLKDKALKMKMSKMGEHGITKTTIKNATRFLQKSAGVSEGRLCVVFQEGLDEIGLAVKSRPAGIPKSFSMIVLPSGTIMSAQIDRRSTLSVLKSKKALMSAIVDWYWQTRHNQAVGQPLLFEIDKTMSLQILAPVHPANKGIKRISRLYKLKPYEMNLPMAIPNHLPGLQAKEVKSLREWLLKWAKDNADRIEKAKKKAKTKDSGIKKDR